MEQAKNSLVITIIKLKNYYGGQKKFVIQYGKLFQMSDLLASPCILSVFLFALFVSVTIFLVEFMFILLLHFYWDFAGLRLLLLKESERWNQMSPLTENWLMLSSPKSIRQHLFPSSNTSKVSPPHFLTQSNLDIFYFVLLQETASYLKFLDTL